MHRIARTRRSPQILGKTSESLFVFSMACISDCGPVCYFTVPLANARWPSRSVPTDERSVALASDSPKQERGTEMQRLQPRVCPEDVYPVGPANRARLCNRAIRFPSVSPPPFPSHTRTITRPSSASRCEFYSEISIG